MLNKLKNKISIKTPAKINLFLDVIEREKAGFHKIITLFQAVSLFDEIIIKKSKTTRIHVNKGQLNDKHNIVEDVIDAYRKKFGIQQDFKITIKKKIPIGAGLGGGSSNAAAVLWGINQLLDLNLPYKELVQMGQNIGKDVPFFFYGGTQFGRHYGEVLDKIDIKLDYYILIVYPELEISTKESYRELKVADSNKGKKHLKQVSQALKSGNSNILIRNLYNIFEKNAFKKFPVLKEIKDELIENGAENALMSGSGSAIFGIFKNKKNVKKANKNLKKKCKCVILVEPFYYGLINV